MRLQIETAGGSQVRRSRSCFGCVFMDRDCPQAVASAASNTAARLHDFQRRRNPPVAGVSV